MNLNWRWAGVADAELLGQWNWQLIRDEGHRNQMSAAELAARMRTWLQHEYQGVIYSVAGSAVGYAVYRTEPDTIYLRHFFVVPDQRRSGVGRAGFGILREIWPENVRLTVAVLSRNTAGSAFWEAMGYRPYCLTLELLPGVPG